MKIVPFRVPEEFDSSRTTSLTRREIKVTGRCLLGSKLTMSIGLQYLLVSYCIIFLNRPMHTTLQALPAVISTLSYNHRTQVECISCFCRNPATGYRGSQPTPVTVSGRTEGLSTSLDNT